MRRILFTAVACGAMLGAVPAVSLAHGGSDHHDRDRAAHHARVRHEQFRGVSRNDVTQNAGTVAAFANGTLTITLADGATVSGAVTRFTRLACDAGTLMHDQDRGPGGNRDNGDSGDGNNVNIVNSGDNDNDGDRGDNDRGEHRVNMCTTVVPGMAVRDAALTFTAGGPVWNRVELIGQ
jgi:hypothetical protein